MIRCAALYGRNILSDYTKSLPEFQKRYPDEDVCAAWQFELR